MSKIPIIREQWIFDTQGDDYDYMEFFKSANLCEKKASLMFHNTLINSALN